ncbi:MAG: FAD-dependent thymidylate synthase [Chloroflexota bacterium]
MKIAQGPSVHLIGRSQIDHSAVDRFLDENAVAWSTDGDSGAELISELAGRVCYMSFGDRQGRRSNREYLENIIELAHGSVLEHVVWTFIVSGVSRSFSHELIRHRAGWAYSQLSQRYVDESDTEFVEPDIIAADQEMHEIWLKSVEQSHEAYCLLASAVEEKVATQQPELQRRNRRKRAREAARSVLPNATETKIVMSANARALRHFIEYRGAADAEPEIRSVALQVLEIMRVEAPNIFGDYRLEEDGATTVSATEHPKV